MCYSLKDENSLFRFNINPKAYKSKDLEINMTVLLLPEERLYYNIDISNFVFFTCSPSI